MAREFVLVRVLNMRGVDLRIFDFDFDLTWAAFFLNADESVYGRFGGRHPSAPERYLTLDGLKKAMRSALARHKQGDRPERPVAGPPRFVEDLPVAKALKPNACIHCHQVYDFGRADQRSRGTWRSDLVWTYPLPENLGLELDPREGNVVAVVKPGSIVAKAGVLARDEILSLDGRPTASFADVQYALHRAPAEGRLRLHIKRNGDTKVIELPLSHGWRETDLTWRASLWSLEPAPCVFGQDLTAAEKKALGLDPKLMAFRQGRHLPDAARLAGLRVGDIVLGVDDKRLNLTALQFQVHIRLHYRVGDRITFPILRDGKRLEIAMTLPARADL